MKMAPRTPDMRGAIMRPALCIRTRALSLNKTARPGSGQSELFVVTNGARTHCHEDPSDNTIAATRDRNQLEQPRQDNNLREYLIFSTTKRARRTKLM
jgi:hypothetical protein